MCPQKPWKTFRCCFSKSIVVYSAVQTLERETEFQVGGRESSSIPMGQKNSSKPVSEPIRSLFPFIALCFSNFQDADYLRGLICRSRSGRVGMCDGGVQKTSIRAVLFS